MFFGSRARARLAVSRKLAGRETLRSSSKLRPAAEMLEDRTLLAALYWDPSGAPVATGGPGTWDTTSAEWRSGNPTGPLVAWNNSANDSAIFPASAGAVTLAADITAKSLTFAADGYLLTGNTLTLANGGRVNVGRGAAATIGSIVAGSGGVTKVGSGVLILSAADSFSGRISINGGNVELANGNADQNRVIAVDVPNGLTFASGIGSFQIAGLVGSGNVSLNNNGGGAVSLTVNSTGANNTYGGDLSGLGSLTVAAGTQTLSGANTYAGGTTLLAGQLNINNAQAIGTGTLTVNGGTIAETTGGSVSLSKNNTQIWNGDFTYAGGAKLNLGSGPVTLTDNLAVTAVRGTLAVSGTISDSGLGYGITKNGSGTLSLSGSNAFGGLTTIDVGSLLLGSAGAVQNSTVVLNQSNGLHFNGNIGSFIVGGLSGDVAQSLTGGGSKSITLVVGNNGSASSFAGVLSGSGSIELVGGTLDLSGSNTYSGGTTVNGGTLLTDNSSGSGTGSGKVIVNSGGMLGGSGAVAGAVTVAADGTLAPGVGGTAGFGSGTLTLASGSNLDVDVNGNAADGGFDSVSVTGAASIGGSNLVLDGATSTAASGSLDMISATGGINGNFQGLAEGGTISYGGVTYSADYTDSSGDDAVLTVTAAAPITTTAPIPPTTPIAPIAPTNPTPPTATPPISSTPSPPITTVSGPSPSPVSVPGTPGLPTVSAPSSSQIEVAWTAVNGATNYVVQRSLNGSTAWSTVGTPTSPSFLDSGLSPSVTYYYQVAASNSAGVSAYSLVVSTAPLSSTALSPSISGNATANHGVVYTLDLSAPTAFKYPANAVLQSWTINWGDGTAALPDLTLVRSQLGLAYHTYLSDGPETITASATNVYGAYVAAPLNIIVVNPPVVSEFQVNDGSAQRSMVDSLTINFDEPVNLSASAFQLTQTATTAALLPGPMGFALATDNGGATYVLSFPQSSFAADVGNSLPNGTYTLTVVAANVTDDGGGAMQYDVHYQFDRLFGDFDGSGTVDSSSQNLFNQSYGTMAGQSGYLWFADADADGAVDSASLTAFDADLGVNYQPTASLNTFSTATAGSPLTISATAGSYGNNGDTLSYLWSVTGPGGAFSVPGGNVTTIGRITIVPNVAGNWSASVVVTDTDLSLSRSSGATSFNVASSSTSQSLAAQFNSTGLSEIAYNGTILAGPGTSATTYAGLGPFVGDVELVDANGNLQDNTSASTRLSGVWNPATLTETYTYDYPAATPVVTVTVQYVVENNTLAFDITASNASPYTMTGFGIGLVDMLQFPEASTAGPFTNGQTLAFVSDQPSYLTADYGTGAMVLGVEQQSPAYLAFTSNLTTTTSNTYGIFFATDAMALSNPNYPALNSPIAAGQSAQYNVNLRFGPTGSGPQLASDYNQAFSSAYPFDLQWNDRRPIAEIYPTGIGGVSSTNPRGWFNDPTVNVTTPAGLTAFSTRLLQSADTSIALMKSMGSQGMIAWDLEGWEFTGYTNTGGFTTYIGDPTQATTMAPELSTTDGVAAGYADVLDEYFAKFRAAGLEVGMTLRPTQVEFVNGQAYQEPVADPAQLLISKIEYARQRWGATLFYIDSTSMGESYYGIAAMLAEVHAAEPDVLLIPETVPIGGMASAAAYAELPAASTGALVPGVNAITGAAIQLVYPGAFSVIRSDKSRSVGEADVPALTEAIARGDTYFIQGANSAVTEAFNDIALQDAYPGKQIYRNDTFVLRLYTPTEASEAEYQILRDGLVIDSFLASSTSSLSFSFAGAHDNLIIDTSGGNPIPSNGVTFNGNSLSNGDTLTIIGSPGDDSISVGSGSASVGTGVVRFSNIAGVTVESVGGSGNNPVVGGTNATPALLVATTDAQIDPSPMLVASASENSVARMDEYSHAYGAWGPFSFVAAAAKPIARWTTRVAGAPTAESGEIERPGFVGVFGNAVIADDTDFSELKKLRSNAWETLENSPS